MAKELNVKIIIGVVIIVIVLIAVYYYYKIKPAESFHETNLAHSDLEFYDQSSNQMRTLDRMNNTNINTLPMNGSNITPYDPNIANPQTYSYSPYLPRSILKDPQAMQADFFRGDIPIKKFDIPIVGGSQFGASSLKLDGYFSDALKQNYDKLSNSNIGNL